MGHLKNLLKFIKNNENIFCSPDLCEFHDTPLVPSHRQPDVDVLGVGRGVVHAHREHGAVFANVAEAGVQQGAVAEPLLKYQDCQWIY